MVFHPQSHAISGPTVLILKNEEEEDKNQFCGSSQGTLFSFLFLKKKCSHLKTNHVDIDYKTLVLKKWSSIKIPLSNFFLVIPTLPARCHWFGLSLYKMIISWTFMVFFGVWLHTNDWLSKHTCLRSFHLFWQQFASKHCFLMWDKNHLQVPDKLFFGKHTWRNNSSPCIICYNSQ